MKNNSKLYIKLKLVILFCAAGSLAACNINDIEYYSSNTSGKTTISMNNDFDYSDATYNSIDDLNAKKTYLIRTRNIQIKGAFSTHPFVLYGEAQPSTTYIFAKSATGKATVGWTLQNVLNSFDAINFNVTPNRDVKFVDIFSNNFDDNLNKIFKDFNSGSQFMNPNPAQSSFDQISKSINDNIAQTNKAINDELNKRMAQSRNINSNNSFDFSTTTTTTKLSNHLFRMVFPFELMDELVVGLPLKGAKVKYANGTLVSQEFRYSGQTVQVYYSNFVQVGDLMIPRYLNFVSSNRSKLTLYIADFNIR